MQITIKQSGGYGGAATGTVATVDTARLEAGQRAHLEQLVRDAAASLRTPQEAVGFDLMRYEITIDDNGTARSLAWTDDGTFGPVKQLIEEVQRLS
jgi:hypothetical protein